MTAHYRLPSVGVVLVAGDITRGRVAFRSLQQQRYPLWRGALVDLTGVRSQSLRNTVSGVDRMLYLPTTDLAAGLQTAVGALSGEVLVLVRDGDQLMPEHLETVTKVFAANPHIGAVVTWPEAVKGMPSYQVPLQYGVDQREGRVVLTQVALRRSWFVPPQPGELEHDYVMRLLSPLTAVCLPEVTVKCRILLEDAPLIPRDYVTAR